MNGHIDDNQNLSCPQCRDGLQDYLDGTMEKTRSLQVFLHLRECAGCRLEHEALQDLFGMLGGLPAVQVPEDFDEAILASVPYAAYQAMEPLRRERIPVFLEEQALPAFLRSRSTRLSGLVLAGAAAAVQYALDGPGALGAVVVLGLVPEALVRLQGIGRRAVLALRRAEG